MGLLRVPTGSGQLCVRQGPRNSWHADGTISIFSLDAPTSRQIDNCCIPKKKPCCTGLGNWRVCEVLKPPILLQRWSTRYRPRGISCFVAFTAMDGMSGESVINGNRAAFLSCGALSSTCSWSEATLCPAGWQRRQSPRQALCPCTCGL